MEVLFVPVVPLRLRISCITGLLWLTTERNLINLGNGIGHAERNTAVIRDTKHSHGVRQGSRLEFPEGTDCSLRGGRRYMLLEDARQLRALIGFELRECQEKKYAVLAAEALE